MIPKRLLKEIENFHSKNKVFHFGDTDIIEIEKDAIYLYVNPSNVLDLYCLVIGPEDTPYQNGYYLFYINITPDYPYSPPHVKYLTTDGTIRFNPNLYANGKVCLSILGTWTGPPWSAVIKLDNLMQYLRMILCSDPLRNEPGFSSPSQHIVEAQFYAEYVSWYNMNYAILNVVQLKNVHCIYKKFHPVICEDFRNKYVQHYEFICRQTSKYLPSNYVHSIQTNWNSTKSVYQKEALVNLLKQFFEIPSIQCIVSFI
jgi:ubiquitin-conjugating enzyme E2 Z